MDESNEVVVSAGRDWRDAAVCRETDPELFFPAASHGPAREEQVAAAKAVCARCPVRAECLEFAFTALTCGVAGGLDEDERRELRRAQTAGRALGGVTSSEPFPSGEGSPAEQARRGRAQGRSVAAIAAELGVSPRTVERWTQAGAA